MQVKPLVELAAQIKGGYRPLARELGIPDSLLHNFIAETRSCPVDIQAMLADIAGLNAYNQIEEALLAKNPGTDRQARLRKAFHNATTRASKATNHILDLVGEKARNS